jgi:hypothetical protein
MTTPCQNRMLHGHLADVDRDALSRATVCGKPSVKRMSLAPCPACGNDPAHTDDISGALCIGCVATVSRVFNTTPGGWAVHACCSTCHRPYIARVVLAALPGPRTSSPTSAEQRATQVDLRTPPQVYADTLGLALAWAAGDQAGAVLAVETLTAPEAQQTVLLLLRLATNTWRGLAGNHGWDTSQLLTSIFETPTDQQT